MDTTTWWLRLLTCAYISYKELIIVNTQYRTGCKVYQKPTEFESKRHVPLTDYSFINQTVGTQNPEHNFPDALRL